ncbi:glycerophosphodiester phosphodiesterase [Orrella daihaiensis]|uniref:glycerophosphodiester phosphodiesterase n=1 Tax=Orrella daihaiensis TaxID=2782176 RepID=A0ABY4AHU0_9BURK|nr:glycerophosphodiester phosphodiesterase [Orrella daihaiensis]UOD49857.1 glycerophosphodiester phosphodiesterase [Orrella daihaiensis]
MRYQSSRFFSSGVVSTCPKRAGAWSIRVLSGVLLMLFQMAALAQQIVIAHRGASGYLPEHTIAAKSMAHAMGADYLEQDLVMTRDGELVVLHDLYLDRVSDVATKFPERAREDGRHYVVDFTLDELRQIKITERRKTDNAADPTMAFPGRFGLHKSHFGIHTFAEELELIRELNRTTGKTVGIYPEIKSPSFHHQNGQDIAAATLQTLKDHGYTTNDGSVYLQSFDPHELKRVKTELMPQMQMDLPLVQLIARTNWKLTQERLPNGQWANYDYDWMLAPGAMEVIAQYADGIGPHIGMLFDSNDAKLAPNALVKQAQARGLVVHPYTVRADALPKGVNSIDELHELLFKQVGVDGVFTDFPDLAVQYLGR